MLDDTVRTTVLGLFILSGTAYFNPLYLVVKNGAVPVSTQGLAVNRFCDQLDGLYWRMNARH